MDDLDFVRRRRWPDCRSDFVDHIIFCVSLEKGCAVDIDKHRRHFDFRSDFEIQLRTLAADSILRAYAAHAEFSQWSLVILILFLWSAGRITGRSHRFPPLAGSNLDHRGPAGRRNWAIANLSRCALSK